MKKNEWHFQQCKTVILIAVQSCLEPSGAVWSRPDPSGAIRSLCCQHCVGYISDGNTSDHWSASAVTHKHIFLNAVRSRLELFRAIWSRQVPSLSTLRRLYKRWWYFRPLECKCCDTQKHFFKCHPEPSGAIQSHLEPSSAFAVKTA